MLATYGTVYEPTKVRTEEATLSTIPDIIRANSVKARISGLNVLESGMPEAAAQGSKKPAKEVNPGKAGASKKLVNVGRALKAERAAEKEEDKKYVAAAKRGEQAGFQALFERYHRRAYAVALGVVKSPADATDLVQDAFVKVHKNIDKFEGNSSFYTWLYRIVMNLSIDHIRKKKRRQNVAFDEKFGDERRALGDAAQSSPLTPHLLDGNPQRTVLRRELASAIAEALDELPEHHRAVVLLREVEGLSYQEIAETLEVPRGTIMSRLFHARRSLQQSLATRFGGEFEAGEKL